MNPIIFQHQPSACSDEESMSSVPSLDHRTHSIESRFGVPTPQDASRASVNTYRSTVSSFEEEEYANDCYYDDAACGKAPPATIATMATAMRAIPATPAEFAELFPTTSRLAIRHDDSCYDGNMNIRVDSCGRTLFHARIYDLRDRDISVRRYGRDCGREVAHAKRKFQTQRPTLQRALSSFRGRNPDVVQKVARVDSGYGSEDDSDGESASPPSAAAPRPKPSNTCALEFANYAHVELTRRGAGSSKKYGFEYWGTRYAWRRVGDQEGSYQLVNTSTHSVAAYIRPDELTPEMEQAEEEKGGFVPPCSLYFVDSKENPVAANRADVADVIVATGLIALIDDSIKRRYHRKRVVQVTLPGAGRSLNMEYVGPRRLMNEMFSRRRPALPRSLSTSTRLKTW